LGVCFGRCTLSFAQFINDSFRMIEIIICKIPDEIAETRIVDI